MIDNTLFTVMASKVKMHNLFTRVYSGSRNQTAAQSEFVHALQACVWSAKALRMSVSNISIPLCCIPDFLIDSN